MQYHHQESLQNQPTASQRIHQTRRAVSEGTALEDPPERAQPIADDTEQTEAPAQTDRGAGHENVPVVPILAYCEKQTVTTDSLQEEQVFIADGFLELADLPQSLTVAIKNMQVDHS